MKRLFRRFKIAEKDRDDEIIVVGHMNENRNCFVAEIILTSSDPNAVEESFNSFETDSPFEDDYAPEWIETEHEVDS